MSNNNQLTAYYCSEGEKNLGNSTKLLTHSGGTETKVKEIVSDIPPHTNQNIGIF